MGKIYILNDLTIPATAAWNNNLGKPHEFLKLYECWALHKIPTFHLISWCGNFVETQSSHRVSGGLPENYQAAKTHQQINVKIAIFLNYLKVVASQ